MTLHGNLLWELDKIVFLYTRYRHTVRTHILNLISPPGNSSLPRKLSVETKNSFYLQEVCVPGQLACRCMKSMKEEGTCAFINSLKKLLFKADLKLCKPFFVENTDINPNKYSDLTDHGWITVRKWQVLFEKGVFQWKRLKVKHLTLVPISYIFKQHEIHSWRRNLWILNKSDL